MAAEDTYWEFPGKGRAVAVCDEPPEHPARNLRDGPLWFTARQGEILSLAAAGFSDSEIAKRLGVAHRTVRTHLERLYGRYGLKNRAAAIAVWLRAGVSAPTAIEK